jgi:hypothetical protein
VVKVTDIQTAIERRISPIEQRFHSLNRDGEPDGSEGRPRVRLQHWVAYTGSDFDSPSEALDRFSQERILLLSSYVELQDLQRDYRRALDLHDLILSVLSNYEPPLEGVLGPITVVKSALVSTRSEGQTLFRYRGDYTLRVRHELVKEWIIDDDPRPMPPPGPDGYSFQVGLYRSPAGGLGDKEVSSKDADVIANIPPLSPL